MRIKLTLVRPGAPSADISVIAEANALVQDIAAALAAPDRPAGVAAPAGTRTLQVRSYSADGSEDKARVLDPGQDLTEAGLRSGAVVEVVAVSEAFQRSGESTTPAAARMSVLSGPDAGQEFLLPFGSSTIGRESTADVRVSDPLISKRHARINISDAVEILDLGSANGILMGGQHVSRTILTSNDVVMLGETELRVTPLQRLTGTTPSGPAVEFVRTPRVIERFAGKEVTAPTPPRRQGRQRFPFLSIVAPIFMGIGLFLVTGQLMSLAFIALSPLLVVGAFVDQKQTAKRELKLQTQQFNDAMDELGQVRIELHQRERLAREQETPSVADVVTALSRRGNLMWTHRPEHDEFLTARLGVGPAPSRSVLKLPSSNDTVPQFWDGLERAARDFAEINDVPVVVDWRTSGALGLSGPRESLDGVARGIALQMIGLHSPAELVVTAFASPASREIWNWLDWLPHTCSPHSPISGEHLADNPGSGQSLLARLEGLVEERTQGSVTLRGRLTKPGNPQAVSSDGPPHLPAVLVIMENDAPIDRARATRLAERGSDANVYVLWCAKSPDQIPAVCRTFLHLNSDGPLIGMVRQGERSHAVSTESVDLESSMRLARGLAPVVDISTPVEDDSDLPRQVSFPAVAGLGLLDDETVVIDKWQESESLIDRSRPPVPRKKDGNLRALVGHSASGPFHLDLRTQGPHALVGGTTGSGKSEFLQAWVLGMAAAHSPDRLTFLFVDYKGGAAFADCVALPHAVGLVTDLSPHLVQRALTSLRAELRYREHLLVQKKAKDLVSLEKKGDPDTPPSLVIVVDEFAALIQEVPEFVNGVVDIAQRGRSLGLHLILATQRPAGVIKDNLRGNTNLRVALRVADSGDSSDILDSPMAASFDPGIPGRAAAKMGPGRITSFQAAYTGGWTTGEVARPRIQVQELNFGSSVFWDEPEAETSTTADQGPSDVARIVETVRRAARAAEVPSPRKPWLKVLPSVYNLKILPAPRTDDRLVLGVMDSPETQSQPTIFYEPDKDGNMAIFGTGGSGKSTALRSLALAAAITPRGGPIQIYGLDFGSGGLRMLEDLPHVGAIVTGDDEERVVRLLRHLRDVVDERAVLYARERAGTIIEYRRLANKPDEPRIILLVDGIGAFREAYENVPTMAQWSTIFAQIAADGRPLGVHVVVTGDRPNSVPPSIISTVQKRLVLRLASVDEYTYLGVASNTLDATSPPGRGILDGHEVQVALFGKSSNLAVQAREIRGLADSMRRQALPSAPDIGRLPYYVSLDNLPSLDARSRASIGLDDDYLAPVGIDGNGAFLLSGPPGSGRTTAVATIGSALKRSSPRRQVLLLGARKSTLHGYGSWDQVADSVEMSVAAALRLTEQLDSGQFEPGDLAILFENVTDFANSEAQAPIDRLVRAAVRAGHFVLGEAESSTWVQATQLAGPFKAARRGILLAPGISDGDNLLGTNLGRVRTVDFPPGRGFLIQRGRGVKLQLAVP